MTIKAEFLKEKEWGIALNDDYKIDILYDGNDSYTIAIIPIVDSLSKNENSCSNIKCNYNELSELYETISSQMKRITEVYLTNIQENQDD